MRRTLVIVILFASLSLIINNAYALSSSNASYNIMQNDSSIKFILLFDTSDKTYALYIENTTMSYSTSLNIIRLRIAILVDEVVAIYLNNTLVLNTTTHNVYILFSGTLYNTIIKIITSTAKYVIYYSKTQTFFTLSFNLNSLIVTFLISLISSYAILRTRNYLIIASVILAAYAITAYYNVYAMITLTLYFLMFSMLYKLASSLFINKIHVVYFENDKAHVLDVSPLTEVYLYKYTKDNKRKILYKNAISYYAIDNVAVLENAQYDAKNNRFYIDIMTENKILERKINISEESQEANKLLSLIIDQITNAYRKAVEKYLELTTKALSNILPISEDYVIELTTREYKEKTSESSSEK